MVQEESAKLVRSPSKEAVAQINAEGAKNLDEDEEEDDALEMSKDKRYQKRNTRVNLINEGDQFTTNIAVDMFSGREVLWHVWDLSKSGFSKSQKEFVFNRIREINVLKNHPYNADILSFWIQDDQNISDETNKSFKLYTITENFGSLRLNSFLKTIKNNVDLKTWQGFCRQILLGLDYLHSCKPSIIHGSLNSQSIYLDHLGIAKICFIGMSKFNFFNKASLSQIEKSSLERPFNYVTQDFKKNKTNTKQTDIFDFGLVALEIATRPNLLDGSYYTPFMLVNILEDSLRKKMIRSCLSFFPEDRPLTNALLTHKAIFEMPSLKAFVFKFINKNEALTDAFDEYLDHESLDPEYVVARSHTKKQVIKVKDIELNKLRDFFNRIKAHNDSAWILFSQLRKVHKLDRALQSTESLDQEQSNSAYPASNEEMAVVRKYEKENRRLISATVFIKEETPPTTASQQFLLTIEILFDNENIREMTTSISLDEHGWDLTEDLVVNRLMSEEDIHLVANKIQNCIDNFVDTQRAKEQDRIQSST